MNEWAFPLDEGRLDAIPWNAEWREVFHVGSIGAERVVIERARANDLAGYRWSSGSSHGMIHIERHRAVRDARKYLAAAYDRVTAR